MTEGTLEIWYTRTASWPYRAALAECAGDLSHEEEAKLDRFLFEPDKLRYLTGKALTKRVLSHHRRDVSPASWRFSMSAFGKPSIGDEQFGSRVHINLSHSEHLIACALSTLGSVGIDIEKVKPLSDLDGMARRFFSAHEYALLSSAEISKKLNLFYTLWTLKESFIKAVGKGLSMPLDNFWFDVSDDGSLDFRAEPALETDPDCWKFWSFALGPGDYRMAIALNCEGSSSSITLKARDFVELTEIRDERLIPAFRTSDTCRGCQPAC